MKVILELSVLNISSGVLLGGQSVQLLWNRWLKKCPACCETDKAHVVRDVPHGKIITADEKFAIISIDFIGSYNDAPRNVKFLLLVVDKYSRWPEVYALPNSQARLLVISLRGYFARLGVPELIRCVEGSSFTSTELTTFIIHQDAALKYSPLYCPRSNGLVERFNQTIRKFWQINFEDSRSWYDALKFVLQPYRSIIHPALGKSLLKWFTGKI